MKYLHVLAFAALCLSLQSCPPREVVSQANAQASSQPQVLGDAILDANIKTVQLYREENPATVAVTYMGSFDPLTLEFDELRSAEVRESDFFVDLISCNEYWEPSGILPIEFFDGFTQDRIQEYQRSEFTKVDYVHYRYQFPQENESFKLSGNYILKVYRENDPSAVVLTRRFVVVEPLVGIGLINEISQAPRRRRMESLSLAVTPGNLNVFNPMNDLRVNLVPNFRFDRTAELTPRQFLEGQLRFEVDLLQLFPQGHEFRPLDIRSTRFLSASIQDVEERDEIFDVFLFPDEPWLTNTFGRQPDLNGNFFLEVQEWPRPQVQSDYVYVYFSLPSREKLLAQDVFVMGKLTDWRLSASNRMRYNEELGSYELELLLKQGYYDYQYVSATSVDAEPNASTFQGRLTDAENFYYVFVYYRGPADRNDRVVGYFPVNG